MNSSNFENAIVSNRTIIGSIDAYIATLNTLPDSEEHVKALINYRSYLVDKRLYRTHRKLLNKVFDALSKNHFFEISGRRKSFLSYEEKLQTSLRKGEDLNVYDILAYRIILNSDDPSSCYEAANIVNKVFSRRKFKLCKAKESLHSTHPSVARIGTNIKDYILNPKDNGYQSLHLIFYKKSINKYVEVQIRTISMHLHAVSGDASHAVYKNNNADRITLDPSKINMHGFTSKGSIYKDNIGLIDPREVLMRSRSC